jgi:ABC-type amino acid transport substrate-binding protein
MNRRRRWLLAAGGLLALVIFLLLQWWWAGDGPLPFLRRDRVWAQIQSTRIWRVGLDPSFPPFEFLNDEGEPTGFDVDLAHAIGRVWEVDVEIVAVGFDSLIDALKAERIDTVLSAYPIDERLTQDILYAQPYFDAGLRLVVRNDSPLAAELPPGEPVEPERLRGLTIAVEWGSEGDMVARQWLREGAALTVRPFETPADGLAALELDATIDALLVDQVTFRQAEAGGRPVIAAGAWLTSNPYAAIAPKRGNELRNALDQALAELAQTGALQQLEEKWFSADLPENGTPE